jgi:hypothetical protein
MQTHTNFSLKEESKVDSKQGLESTGTRKEDFKSNEDFLAP